MPGGVSIKGGRPTQAGVQIGASTLTDPVLGLVHFTLPDDAIDSVAVMPNPYAVEYGRFSSGLVVIQTRRGGDAWHVRLNNLSPTFRSKRHEDLYNINGIAGCGPEFRAGRSARQEPPLPRADRAVPLQQRRRAEPSGRRAAHHALDQLVHARRRQPDAEALAGRHRRISFRASPRSPSLGTFTPPDATVDVRERVMLGTVTERALWSDALVSESTVQMRGYHASVQPQGTAPMQLRPETTLGNFFNTQYRSPTTFQFIQTASGSAKGRTGLHLFKVGLDLLVNDYDGTSDSRPLLIERSNGDAGAAPRRVGAVGADAADHRRRALCAGPRAAELALVRRVRRPRRSRRRDRPLERDAADRRRAAAERGRQLGAARRLRPVLRAHAVGGRRLQVRPVRNLHRHALRRRRRDAAGAAGALSSTSPIRACCTARAATWDVDLRVPLAAVVLGARRASSIGRAAAS